MVAIYTLKIETIKCEIGIASKDNGLLGVELRGQKRFPPGQQATWCVRDLNCIVAG